MKKTPNVLQFICPTGLYGAEMWILALVKNLKKSGCENTLAVSHESEYQNLELLSRYRLLNLPAYALKMRGKFDVSIIYKLVKLVKERQIDIIHTHGYKSDILGLAVARLSGIKAISTPHGFENAKNFKLQLFIKAGCQTLKYFDMIAPLSEELALDMERFEVQKLKINLIQNGVDLDEIETAVGRKYRSPGSLDNSFKKIGYVGQMSSRKNITDLIRSFDRLYKAHRGTQLLLIGDGPMRKELVQFASTLSCSNQVQFLGYRQDRLELVNHLDVFCMTSSLEGIPRCMMEAMAVGKPVAAFDIPGVDKLIINGKTGLSAAFGDVPGLTDCLEKLLFEPDLSKRIAENGKAHIYENFSAARMAGEYLALYEKLLD